MIPRKMSSSMSRLRPSNAHSASELTIIVDLLARDGAAAVTVEPLSDLTLADARALKAAWPALARDTRLGAVSLMSSLGKDDIRLDFERALIVALGDEDPTVRLEAATALWECESSTLLEQFLHRIPAELDDDVRLVFVNGLGRFARLASEGRLTPGQSECVKTVLIRTLEEDSNGLVRLAALAAVSYLRPAGLANAIRLAFDEGGEAAQLAAVKAMGRYGGREWSSRIIDALRSEDTDLRVEAALAAPYVEDRRALPFLYEAAEDEDEIELQLAAISALGEVGGEQVRKFLEEIRDSSSGPVAEAAENALGQASLLDGFDLASTVQS